MTLFNNVLVSSVLAARIADVNDLSISGQLAARPQFIESTVDSSHVVGECTTLVVVLDASDHNLVVGRTDCDRLLIILNPNGVSSNTITLVSEDPDITFSDGLVPAGAYAGQSSVAQFAIYRATTWEWLHIG